MHAVDLCRRKVCGAPSSCETSVSEEDILSTVEIEIRVNQRRINYEGQKRWIDERMLMAEGDGDGGGWREGKVGDVRGGGCFRPPNLHIIHLDFLLNPSCAIMQREIRQKSLFCDRDVMIVCMLTQKSIAANQGPFRLEWAFQGRKRL